MDISITDKRGNFLAGLEQKNFRVFDDSEERPIIFFAPVEAPAQILVFVETSPAVYLIHKEHIVAAYALLEGLAADDEVALVSYDRAPRPIFSLTADKSVFATALGQLQYTLGSSELNFYDSLATIIDWLAPAPGKKAAVLLTTGLDSSSPEHWSALVQKLRASDVVLFPVALGGSLRHIDEQGAAAKKESQIHPANAPNNAPGGSSPLSFARADDALRELARISGGRAYFPEAAKDFPLIYREIAAVLRHEYTLGFAPQHDGKFHSIAVQVLDKNGQPLVALKKSPYRIFHREGYLAPEEPGPITAH